MHIIRKRTCYVFLGFQGYSICRQQIVLFEKNEDVSAPDISL